MKIGIIIGSTRPGRVGAQVGQWVDSLAQQRDDADFEVVDLSDFDLDLLNEETVPGAANREYENPKTQAWSKKIDQFDGYVFVTAEYNHGVPAAFKNAVDVLYPEWTNKAVGFVGYGADGGIRAVEHWRGIVANLSMTDVRAQVALSLFTDFTAFIGGTFTPADRRADELTAVLDQVVAATSLLARVDADA